MTEETKKAKRSEMVRDYEKGSFVLTDPATGKSTTGSIDDMPEAMLRKCALYGYTKRVVDSFADKSTNVLEAAQKVIDKTVAGEWTTARTGGAPRVTDTLEALVLMFTDAGQECTTEQAGAIWKGWDKDTQKACRASAGFQKHAAAIALKKAKAKAAAAAKAEDGGEFTLPTV